MNYCETVKEDIFKGLKRDVKDNLSPQARIAMKEIQERVKRKEWAVRPADKGGGICVEPYEHIVEDGIEELKDETTFGKVEKPRTGSTIRKVEEKLKEMRDKGYITTKMRDFLRAKNTKGGTMKINRKVHKKVKGNGRHPTSLYFGNRDTNRRNSRIGRGGAKRGSRGARFIHPRYGGLFEKIVRDRTTGE